MNNMEMTNTISQCAKELKEKAIKNTYDFVMYFDVTDGNPNGNPDANNAPRQDYVTGEGEVSCDCIKHKIREAVMLLTSDEETNIPRENNDILVREGGEFTCLNAVYEHTYKKCGLTAVVSGTEDNEDDMIVETETTDGTEVADKKKKSKGSGKVDKTLQKVYNEAVAGKYMCDNYFDVRTFGQVMTTGEKNAKCSCGVAKGPVSFANVARSVDPVDVQEMRNVRCKRTNNKDEKTGGTFSTRYIIPYGLYKMTGSISACLAQRTGFSEEDFELFKKAIVNMFRHDRSVVRGEMHLRKFVVFKHESRLGNCANDELYKRVTAVRKEGVDVARSIDDYIITVNTEDMPNGVTPDIVDCNVF